jgi:hypothetical protein
LSRGELAHGYASNTCSTELESVEKYWTSHNESTNTFEAITWPKKRKSIRLFPPKRTFQCKIKLSTHVWREILVKEWPWHNTTTETKHFYKSGSETMWPRKLSSPTLSMVPVVNSRMQFRRRHITHSFICWILSICKVDFFFTF